MTPEDAVQSLYETPNLFGDLRDEDASVLLKWAEAQVMRLAKDSPDETAFDLKMDALHRLAGQINTYVGQRHNLSFEARQAAFNAIAVAASSIGLEPLPLEASLSAQTADDDGAILQSILGMFAPSQPNASPSIPKASDEHASNTRKTDEDIHG
jgi:hypothetical protein